IQPHPPVSQEHNGEIFADDTHCPVLTTPNIPERRQACERSCWSVSWQVARLLTGHTVPGCTQADPPVVSADPHRRRKKLQVSLRERAMQPGTILIQAGVVRLVLPYPRHILTVNTQGSTRESRRTDMCGNLKALHMEVCGGAAEPGTRTDCPAE
ncbi:hypothetical protein JOQ06_002109, partial [Pogonophryne albipinna]